MSKFLRIQRHTELFKGTGGEHNGVDFAEQTWRLNGLPIRFHMATTRWHLHGKDVELEVYTKPPSDNEAALGRDHWLVKGDKHGRIKAVESWWFDSINGQSRHYSSKAESDFFILDASDSMIDLFGITYKVNETLSVTMCLRDYLNHEIPPVDYIPSKAVCCDRLIESWVKENDERPDVIGKP